MSPVPQRIQDTLHSHRVCVSALEVPPGPTVSVSPGGTPAPLGCRNYEAMDHQRLHAASAEGWTRHTWNEVSMALSRAELPPCFPAYGPESCTVQSLGFLWSRSKQKTHPSLCHQELSLTHVPDASITHHSFSSR